MTERERWEMAANLLDAFGDDVGPYVIAQLRACIAAKDYIGAQDWNDIAGKIGEVADPDDDVVIQ